MLPILSRQTPRRSWFAVALALLVALQTATPVWAWGRLGHRLTARLAERHLTPKAKAAITALLEPGESLADASTWADEHKRDIRAIAPWHYVDVPLDEPRYDARFTGDDPRKGYIVPKLMEFVNVLGNPAAPVEERRVALRFVVHLVGDLHQPLHVGDNHDRGGNDTQVRFFARGSNMHRVWDSDIIDHANKTPDGWLADLAAMDTPEARGKAMAGSVEDWATESLLAARQAYEDPVTGKRIKSGTKLADAYQEANLSVVRRRLDQGGVRLAIVLNEVFPEK
jgi:nuclease S1